MRIFELIKSPPQEKRSDIQLDIANPDMQAPRIACGALELPRRNEFEVFFQDNGLFLLVLEGWDGAGKTIQNARGWVAWREENGVALYQAGYPLLKAFNADPAGLLAKNLLALATPAALKKAKDDGYVSAVRRYGTLYGGVLATRPETLAFKNRPEPKLIWPYAIRGNTAYGDKSVPDSLDGQLFAEHITIVTVTTLNTAPEMWGFISETQVLMRTEWFEVLPQNPNEQNERVLPQSPTLDFAGTATSAA